MHPNMKIKHPTIMAVAVSLFPFLAQAQAQVPASGGEPSTLWSLFWTILPIVIIVPIFILFIRRMQKPIMKRTQDHMARQVQHMDRVEQLLERIAKAVEKKDTNVA